MSYDGLLAGSDLTPESEGLILKELPRRLEELPSGPSSLGKTGNVIVRLDGDGWALVGAGLNRVRIKRAAKEPLYLPSVERVLRIYLNIESRLFEGVE